MREITLESFVAAHRDGAYVIDVREPMEYVSGHVPRAELVPMGQLPGKVAELPKDRTVYVICASGNRSLAMTDFLQRAGVQATSVAGGTNGWASAGHPIVTGPRANAA
ncbi:MAG: rhodanese-like domain-containing protein [Angustibacter sp.]